jgi:hypothetical protein
MMELPRITPQESRMIRVEKIRDAIEDGRLTDPKDLDARTTSPEFVHEVVERLRKLGHVAQTTARSGL